MNTTIRGLDPNSYKELKARAALENRPIGELVNDAIRSYLSRPAPLEKNLSLRDLKPWDFGPGTENLSQEIDDVAYEYGNE
jgi:hypothetical protein